MSSGGGPGPVYALLSSQEGRCTEVGLEAPRGRHTLQGWNILTCY